MTDPSEPSSESPDFRQMCLLQCSKFATNGVLAGLAIGCLGVGGWGLIRSSDRYTLSTLYITLE